MEYKISVISGDGIGPEIMKETLKVLKKIGQIYNHEFQFIECCAGGASIDKYGEPITEENFNICKNSDAIILGNIGGAKWKDYPMEKRPERVLFKLRGELGFSVNIRPVFLKEYLKKFSPLKDEILKKGIDITVIRDVTGGGLPSEKYSGEGTFGREAFDKEYYNEKIVSDTAKWAFETARKRNNKVLSLDKANGLISSVLWRTVMKEVATKYPDVKLEHMFIDGGAMDVVKNASKYDVIVAPNIFGDIISDELSGLVGSVEVLPAATLDMNGKGMFEPNQLHNTNYEIIGKNIANPIGLILSAALMLKYSFNLEQEATAIEKAVAKAISDGYATEDIYYEGKKLVGTSEMGSIIADYINCK
ncbi:3-isopropylmalate dehydrogenase [Clostridium saccharobutylicum]|uniref:3-isopropylmalate dehydrogenase n=1 Tax=Clostridium saccharobutylicum TaxID=169679 RepID=A0A1S8MTH5_CLOSA|nr:3-isopropylmalate dehydrogenase [Clostridium saccharobutylicum]OOM07482.1 3-isopropylmalate dehydrogenase [Clostridium saccharobutylicum]